jgi:hypothetical protein
LSKSCVELIYEFVNYRCNIVRLGDSCMILEMRCIRVAKIEPRDNTLNMRIILKMSTVTIHYFRGFRTINVYN